jgi:nucleotide-binding universal stress UspA family protein
MASGPVIAAFDGSRNADLALRQAVELAGKYGAELIVVNVQPSLNTRNTRRFFSKEDIAQYEQETGLHVLEKTREYLQSTGIKYEYAVLTGAPAEEICAYAREIHAGFIVMGKRGMNPILTKILGSVSAAVIDKAGCPVVIVPSEA